MDALHQSFSEMAQKVAAQSPALGGDRGGQRRLLIDMYSETPQSNCLFLPDKYFSQLTRLVFMGITGHAQGLSSSARNLFQFTMADTLSWIITSTCIAVSEMTSQKTISSHNLNTRFRILSQRSEILQADLLEYPGLDELSTAIHAARPPSSRDGRSRFA